MDDRETTGVDRQWKVTLKEEEGHHIWKVLHKICKPRSPLRLFFHQLTLMMKRWGELVRKLGEVSSQKRLYEFHAQCAPAERHTVCQWKCTELQINTQPQSACVWLIVAHRKTLFIEPIAPHGLKTQGQFMRKISRKVQKKTICFL